MKDIDDYDLVCFSHFKWHYVFGRAQHLMSHAARERRVFYVQEPESQDKGELRIDETESGVKLVTPSFGYDTVDRESHIKMSLEKFFKQEVNPRFVLWYYTPRAVVWTRDLKPLVTVYDCTEQLCASGTANELLDRKAELLSRADLVFTGGQSLYEEEFSRHPHVCPFPSRVDLCDFEAARKICQEPYDQAGIAHPRLGFFGIIDERLDFCLIKAVAEAHPEWHVIFIGPIEVEKERLPAAPNIHYLGFKDYASLAQYIAGWDVAIIPFVDNEATRCLNPTKTSEYLAAGTPVVSTPIPDVVRPYALKHLVRIAGSPEDFIASCARCLESGAPVDQKTIDQYLYQASWEKTWLRMSELIHDAIVLKSEGHSDAGLHRDFRQIGSRLGTPV